MFIVERFDKICAGLKKKFQSNIIIFILAVSAQGMDQINFSAFFTSVEEVQSHFGCSYALASWALSAYTVTFSSFITFFGRCGDILGHRQVFNWGLFFLAIFSVISAAVDNIYVLIVFRAFQGIAAAATIPSSYALVVHTFNGKALSIAIGWLTAALTICQAIGLVIGGAFSMTTIGYKGILWLISGVTVVNLLLGYIFVDESEKSENAGSMKNLDYPGVVLFISGAILLVTGFTEAGSSWKSPRAYVLIVIGVLLIVLFFLWEAFFFNGVRGGNVDLVIPKPMWSVKNFKTIPVVCFFMYGGYSDIMLLATEFFQHASQKSPVLSGVMFGVPLACSQLVVVAIISLKLVNLKAKTLCMCGLTIGFVGILLYTRISIGQYWRYGFTGAVLFAGGAVTYFVTYLNLIILATPLEMQGLVSGICLTLGQFGSSVFISGVTSILGDSLETSSSHSEIAKKITNAMYLPLAAYAVSICLVVVLVKNLDPENQQLGKTTSSECSQKHSVEVIEMDCTVSKQCSDTTRAGADGQSV